MRKTMITTHSNKIKKIQHSLQFERNLNNIDDIEKVMNDIDEKSLICQEIQLPINSDKLLFDSGFKDFLDKKKGFIL